MTHARVSVAMTTFDGSAHVEEQLESIARQTRLPDELVVCDDASGDDTPARLEAFARRAPFEVRVERNPENLNTTPNFEKAVSLCRGEVVLFADQDDVWRPHKIETLAGLLEASPGVGAVFSNARVVDERRAPLGYTLWDSLWFHPAEREKVRRGRGLEVFVKHVVSAGTTLAFRARFRDLYLPFPRLRDCHDAWVTFTIASVADVRIVEECLLDYRLHGENQFGLKRFGLREQIEKAREQLAIGAFSHNVRFFTAAKERLAEHAGRYAPSPAALALIDGKIEHARRRDQMAPSLWGRLPAVLRETVNGGYWRYSYGVKSLAQDLLLR